jgi:hypothetical protein
MMSHPLGVGRQRLLFTRSKRARFLRCASTAFGVALDVVAVFFLWRLFRGKDSWW